MILTLIKRAIDTILILLFSLSPFIFYPLIVDTFRMPKEVFARIFIILLMGLWFIERIESGERALPGKPLTIIAFIFNLTGIFSFMLNKYSSLGTSQIKNLFLFFFLYIIICDKFRSIKKIRLLMQIFVITALLSAIYAIIQFFGLDPIFRPKLHFYSRQWVTTGFIGQPTLLGGFLGPIVFLTIPFVILSNSKWKRLFFILSLGIILLGLFFTYTRAMFLGIALGILFFLILLSYFKIKVGVNQNRIIMGLFVFIGIAGVIFLALNPSFVKKIKKAITLEAGAGSRIFYWSNCLKIIKENPIFGVGYGNFRFAYYEKHIEKMRKDPIKYKKEGELIILQAHNEFLQVATEAGLFSLIIFLWLIFAYFKSVFISLKRRISPQDKILLASIATSMFVLIIDAIFSFPFHIVPTALLGTALLAMGISLRREEWI